MPETIDIDYMPDGLRYRRVVTRRWETQSRPYVKALPYRKTVQNNRSPVLGTPNTAGLSKLQNSWIIGAARNKAINNLHNKLQVAQLGNAIGEYKSSANMIATRAKQLTQAYREVKRGRLGDAASTLGISRPKRTRAKSAAGIWLEYHYGWSPLIDDVYSASSVFHSGRQPKVMRFSGRSGRQTRVSDDVKHTRNHIVREDIYIDDRLVYNVAVEDLRYTYQYQYDMRCEAEAVCHLRDVTTIQRLQLDNPASIAWELVPFSFIADWFFPIGTYITSLSPAFRKQLISSSVTVKATNNVSATTQMVHDKGLYGPVYDQVASKEIPSDIGDSFLIERTLGLGISNTMDRSFLQGDSFLRAGHAIALLVSAFRS